MKGIRFYEEMSGPRGEPRRSLGNCFAAFWCNGTRPDPNDPASTIVDGVGGVYEHPNSPVAGTGASVERFLRARCRRVSEARARAIHPNLFADLDAGNQAEAAARSAVTAAAQASANAAPDLLDALKTIAEEADFSEEDGAMDLGQRLLDIQECAEAALEKAGATP